MMNHITECDDATYRVQTQKIQQFSNKYLNNQNINKNIPQFSFVYWKSFIILFIQILISLVTINMVFNTTQNPFFRLASSLIIIIQTISYLSFELSNPKTINKQTPKQQSNLNYSQHFNKNQSSIKSFKQKYCTICHKYVKSTISHCSINNMCIEQHQHSFWLSKCISKQNKQKYYILLSITPIFIIYSFLSLSICTIIQIQNVILDE